MGRARPPRAVGEATGVRRRGLGNTGGTTSWPWRPPSAWMETFNLMPSEEACAWLGEGET